MNEALGRARRNNGRGGEEKVGSDVKAGQSLRSGVSLGEDHGLKRSPSWEQIGW